MTAINLHIAKSQAVICVDSQASLPMSGEPAKFVSKAFPLMHIHTVVLGSGTFQFVLDWVRFIQEQSLATNVLDLDRITPEYLNKLVQKYSDQGLGQNTIYQIGYMEKDESIHAFSYRSNDQFTSKQYEYVSTVTKPPVEIPDVKTLPDDLYEAMVQQKIDDDKKATSEKVGIGGKCFAILVDRNGIFISGGKTLANG